jgi:hypothetical protein
MGDEDEQEGLSVITQIEFGPPKYQTTIPRRARKVLGVDDLDDDQSVIVQAELTLQDVYTKD